MAYPAAYDDVTLVDRSLLSASSSRYSLTGGEAMSEADQANLSEGLYEHWMS